MSDGTETASRLLQVHKTLCKLLADRGFTVPEELSKITAKDFKARYNPNDRSSLEIRVAKEDGTQLLVHFVNEEKMPVSAVGEFFRLLEAEDIHKAILVVRKGMTSFARKEIPDQCRQRAANGFQIEVDIFLEAELVVNITEHVLVPQHVVMSAAEKKQLLAKYHVTEAQLPRILATDPVARYYGLKRGQCCRIIRDSVTAGRYVSYRICV